MQVNIALTCPHCTRTALIMRRIPEQDQPLRAADFAHADESPCDGSEQVRCDACQQPFTPGELVRLIKNTLASLPVMDRIPEQPAPDPRVRTPDRRVRGPAGDREVRPQ